MQMQSKHQQLNYLQMKSSLVHDCMKKLSKKKRRLKNTAHSLLVHIFFFLPGLLNKFLILETEHCLWLSLGGQGWRWNDVLTMKNDNNNITVICMKMNNLSQMNLTAENKVVCNGSTYSFHVLVLVTDLLCCSSLCCHLFFSVLSLNQRILVQEKDLFFFYCLCSLLQS